jgi:hypothetical protein
MNRDTLISLRDRVRAATGPDRGIDAICEIRLRRHQAYAVGLDDSSRAHWKPIGTAGEVHEGGTRYHAPLYSRSTDAGLVFLERLDLPWMKVLRESLHHCRDSKASSLPLALLEAALTTLIERSK